MNGWWLAGWADGLMDTLNDRVIMAVIYVLGCDGFHLLVRGLAVHLWVKVLKSRVWGQPVTVYKLYCPAVVGLVSVDCPLIGCVLFRGKAQISNFPSVATRSCQMVCCVVALFVTAVGRPNESLLFHTPHSPHTPSLFTLSCTAQSSVWFNEFSIIPKNFNVNIEVLKSDACCVMSRGLREMKKGEKMHFILIITVRCNSSCCLAAMQPRQRAVFCSISTPA